MRFWICWTSTARAWGADTNMKTMKKPLFLFLILFGGTFPSSCFAQDEAEALSDYKTACLSAIDNINKIGDNLTMRSLVSAAKASLNFSRTKDNMGRTMTALRTGVLGYMQTVREFPNGQVFTGLIGNHSFDTGDLSLWYSVSFDLSQISLTDVTNAITTGDVSGLVKAVSVNNWNDNTQPVENEGSNAVQGGDQKYHLSSNQLIMQPLIGLPAGDYCFSAKGSCNPGFLKIYKVHLNALIIPISVVQEIVGGVISENPNWGEFFSNFDMQQYIAPFLQNGKLYYSSTGSKNLQSLSDAELNFTINEGDIALIGINAGMTPFIGTEQYNADNLQLTLSASATNIKTIRNSSSCHDSYQKEQQHIYNLSGQMTDGQKGEGIIIKNGKKIFSSARTRK